MRLGRFASFAMLALGALLLGWAAFQGAVTLHLFLFIPIIQGTGALAALGGLLLIGGFFMWILTSLRKPGTPQPRQRPPNGAEDASREARTQSGGILLIGPIPVAWGSDRTTLLVLILAAITLMTTATVLLWLLSS